MLDHHLNHSFAGSIKETALRVWRGYVPIDSKNSPYWSEFKRNLRKRSPISGNNPTAVFPGGYLSSSFRSVKAIKLRSVIATVGLKASHLQAPCNNCVGAYEFVPQQAAWLPRVWRQGVT